jgi:molybdopterin/thiamine biosynthesis adenylyltransferase
VFDYHQAFDRNIGWLTAAEQGRLRRARVAVAGAGGVGGAHLLTLARLGIGGFAIADADRYELANFNRQVGATCASLGRNKAAVMAEQVAAINPEAEIRVFADGVTEANLDRFLDRADLLVDGFDFHAMAIRRATFAAAQARGIPAVTAGPIGLSTAYVVFTAGGMSFEGYFGMARADDPALDPAARQAEMERLFLAGLAPERLFQNYLVDPSRFDLKAQRAPSIGAACQLCAGVVGITAIKLLTGRGDVKAAPWRHQFDPFLNVYVCEERLLPAALPRAALPPTALPTPASCRPERALGLGPV